MTQITLEQGQITAMINYLQAYAQMMVIDMNKCDLYAQMLPHEYRKDMRDRAETLFEHLGYFAELIEQLETARGDIPQSDVPSLEFSQAMKDYHSTAEKYGEDSEQAKDAFIKAFRLAPQHLKDEADKMAKEMGLLPKPSGFSDDGEPLFSSSDLAKHFGMSEDEVIAGIDRLDSTHEHLYHGNINRIQ